MWVLEGFVVSTIALKLNDITEAEEWGKVSRKRKKMIAVTRFTLA